MKVDEKYVFMNTDGDLVIDATYSQVWAFSKGLAGVLVKGSKRGFIDREGDTVLPCVYKSAWEFRGGVFLARL